MTITTTGYGDLTPATDLGRSLAIAEALTGQIYLVTVVAAIVGGLSRRLLGAWSGWHAGTAAILFTMADQTVRMRIALAQVNATVGDIDGNARLIEEWITRAQEAGAQLVVFPEQVVTGYPAEDLWLKPHFLDAARSALEGVASAVKGIVAIVGFPERDAAMYNSAAVLADGGVRGTYRKVLLPNYSVFDERRYFEPGDGPAVIELGGVEGGPDDLRGHLVPGAPRVGRGARRREPDRQPSASPYHRGKGLAREGWSQTALARRARRSRCATSSGARTSWSSTATAWSSPIGARPWRGRLSSVRSFCLRSRAAPPARDRLARAGERRGSAGGAPPPGSCRASRRRAPGRGEARPGWPSRSHGTPRSTRP